ncbi:mesothelin-like protein [Notothenia coriiceps]|uniref:Mesothelin-like protein n=1 Tax=Notothenia coriiceps TaxID=8208 RepID=A0A6I9N0B6_9TELE|nr:PREDICTED: mesothelin-like protein [Notothenia coriiceps]
MFFESLGETDFDTEKLNPTVLQGFTCNTVRKMKKKRVRGLIRSCRPRKGRAKVKLEETQLTCMYNQLKGNLSQDFVDYPSDMLIYLNIKDVQGANCRSYFTALGAADFTVASSVLNKDSGLFSEAQNCLGCHHLECKNPGRPRRATSLFNRKLLGQIQICCTVGDITQMTVSDNAFPFGYDLMQFDLCLDIPVLKDSLDSFCQKVDDNDFQTVILRKLNEAYPLGVPEEQVQVLGSVSRVATLNDISKWTITKVDTLAALMKTEDGSWEAAKSKAIITKYLETPGNSLGATELNSIDSNLCSLDISALEKIKPDSIRNAKPLNLASCSTEQKKVLYEISKISFVSQSSNPTTYYNLIRPYLGGAPLTDVVELSKQNIHMDLKTFRSLDPNVISKLTAADVKALLGANLPDLKVFENATTVETWRNLLTQTELDTLGVGLTTSRATPTTAPPNPATVKTTKGKATTAKTVKTTPAKPITSTAPRVTTTTTAQVNATSGGAQLAKHPTSMFLAALLTAVLLQLLQ